MARWEGGPLSRNASRRQYQTYSFVVVLALVVTFVLLASTLRGHQLSYAYTRGRLILSSLFRPEDFGYFCSAEEAAAFEDGLKNCSSLPALSLGIDSVFGSSREPCLSYDGRYTRPSPCNLGSARCEYNISHAQESGRPVTAIVLRAWEGFQWTADDIRNIQAMISELSLLGSTYTVHILLHLTNGTQEASPEATISRHIPEEFTNITEIWTYADCKLAYPAVGEYDFYYHAFMALQLFADRHTEYDFFWNWEMDARHTGRYDNLFSSLTSWANNQSRDGLWQRNTRFYIPSYHGSYEDFTASTAIADPDFPTPTPWVGNHSWSNTTHSNSEPDLITLFPMFDVSNTRWPHRNYAINYTLSEISRFGTVGTNMRLSRSLLQVMSDENKAGRAMMTEMWPPTLAFHHNLKAVAVPHPIYFDEQWTAADLQDTFNAGEHGRVGGSWTSVINEEHYFRRATWFWNAKLPLTVYQRWLNGRGSAGSESLCLPPMLLHPVKSEHLYA